MRFETFDPEFSMPRWMEETPDRWTESTKKHQSPCTRHRFSGFLPHGLPATVRRRESWSLLAIVLERTAPWQNEVQP